MSLDTCFKMIKLGEFFVEILIIFYIYFFRLFEGLCMILSLFIVGVRSQLKYCNMTECGTRIHVGCLNPTGAWNVTNCPLNPNERTLVSLSEKERSQFLFMHNKWRNHIALGLHPRFKKAARMAELVTEKIASEIL